MLKFLVVSMIGATFLTVESHANDYTSPYGSDLVADVEGWIQQKESELSQCRENYKSTAKQYSDQLENLKNSDPIKVPSFHSESQKNLEELARNCKAIKERIATLQKYKTNIEPVVYASEGKKFGPKIKCYQIGQNWTEFQQCSKELNSSIGFSVSKFSAGDVTASLNNEHRVDSLKISGYNFWGTTDFDKQFLQAFMHKYGINKLMPGIDNDGDQYYEYEGKGWRVKLYSGGYNTWKQYNLTPRVIFSFTSDSSKYTF